MNSEELVLNNMNLIYTVMKSMNLYWKTKDEWQEYFDNGLLGLINGTRAYNPNMNVAKSTFFCKCIKNEILKGIYLSTMKKRKMYKENMLSLDSPINDDENVAYLDLIEDTSINIEEDFIRKNRLEEITEIIDKLLTKNQKEIFYRYYELKGYEKMKISEIAKLKNCSRQAIQQTLKNSRVKLRSHFKNKKDLFM